MEAKDKIRKYLEFKGIRPYTFYKETGLSHGYLDSGSNLNSDKVKIIIEKYPDLNLEWLVMDKGPMIVDFESEEEDSRPIPQSENSLLRLILLKDEQLRNLAEETGSLKEQIRALRKIVGYNSNNQAAEPE